ncbi:MAG: hypothetical protein V4610_10465 [Pseudomonadota bacterium]|jgi:hypothetical protein
MDHETQPAKRNALSGDRKAWETPTFERYDLNRETQGKYRTVTEFTSTTGPAS